MDDLPAEEYYGNTEYKILIKDDINRNNKLTTQMSFRLKEGNGVAVYWLGVLDNGHAMGTIKKVMDVTLMCLYRMAESLGATPRVIKEINVGTVVKQILNPSMTKFANLIIGDGTEDRFIYCIELRTMSTIVDFEIITIGLMGNTNSGKSTLLGTLMNGQSDDGSGSNRGYVFQHLHEFDKGYTSSINEINFGVVKNTLKHITDGDTKYEKMLNFYDLAGNEKYLKTTIKGISHYKPNYCAITIDAGGEQNNTLFQHIVLCYKYKIPFIIIITKIDKVSSTVYLQTLKWVTKLLKSNFNLTCNHIIDNEIDSVNTGAKHHNQIPIISISCVTGHGIDILTKVLTSLENTKKYVKYLNDKNEYYICEIYKGTQNNDAIVYGFLSSGKVSLNDKLLVGPNDIGDYLAVDIKNIMVRYNDVSEVSAGYHASFYISTSNADINLFSYLKKEMVMIEESKSTVHKTIMIDIELIGDKIITVRHKSSFLIQINNIRKKVTVKDIKDHSGNPIKSLSSKSNDVSKGILKVEFDGGVYVKNNDICVLTDSGIFATGIVINCEK